MSPPDTSPAPDVQGKQQGRDADGRLRVPSLQRVIALRLALVAALPMLALVLILQALHDRSLRRGMEQELRQLAYGTASQIDLYIDQHLAALSTVAALGTDLDPARPADAAGLGRLLDRSHRQQPGFLSLLVAAPDGSLAAASLPDRGAAGPLLGKPGTVSDRSYFQIPMRDHRPYVSEVFRGRGFGTDLIVALAVPLRGPAGAVRGVVEGSLDLGRLSRFDPVPDDPDLAVLLLDADQRVIYASPGSHLKPLNSLAESPALQRVQAAAAGEVVSYLPPRGETDSACLLARWPLREGWQVVARRHTTRLDLLQRQAAGSTLALLALALAATVLIARGLAEQVAAPIRRLADGVAGFESESDPLTVPDQAPREVQDLFAGYAALSRRLRQTLREQRAALAESGRLRDRLQESLAEREQQVEARTRELSERGRALQIVNAELAIANAELERLTGEDALTGVANRRAFEDFLSGAWRLAQRQNQPLALILLDVDHFKLFNDHHGHPAGDSCLRQIAHAAKGRLRRPADLFARYGGEEFVAVLGQTDLEQARRLAEGLRKAIHELALTHGARGAGPRVTASFGVAALVPDGANSREQLLALADAALYAAKRGGRDRVCAAGDPPPLSGNMP